MIALGVRLATSSAPPFQLYPFFLVSGSDPPRQSQQLSHPAALFRHATSFVRPAVQAFDKDKSQ